MAQVKKTTLHVKGMHCASCNILIEDKFKELDNVHRVKANFSRQEAEVYYSGHLNKDRLNRCIASYGYMITDRPEAAHIPFWQRLTEVGTLAGILFILYFFAQEMNIIPKFNTSAGSTLTYLSVFVLGLIASTSTCMATSGALFIATIGKQQKTSASITSNLLPAVSFNAGRILSYGFFGFVVGFIGRTLIQNVIFSSFMTVFIAAAMVLVGLSMTGLMSFTPLMNNGFTKNIFQTLEGKLIKHPKKTAFFLGAITYLLPCGFTQSVQIYALSLANPLHSAIIMMTFALGTTPMLTALAFTNSFKSFSFYPYFQKIVGIIIFSIGITYALNFLALHGVRIGAPKVASANQNVEMKDGYQIVRMTVDSRGYTPNSFVVKQNVPVRWIVKGENVFGCQGFIVAPQIGIQKALQIGENIFEFTPTSKGLLTFSCSMGMYRGQFSVL